MFSVVRRDIQRYIVTDGIRSPRKFIEMLLFNYSLWVVLSYRFGRWVRNEFKLPIISSILKIITKITHQLLSLLTGIYIDFGTKIGPGLYIGHVGMLIINSKAVIGEDCNIGIGVVIGQGGRDEKKGYPVIGDRVFIGVGAKIFGKITIGNDAAIGANAVVTKDVPFNVTVAGIPAKIINEHGSKGLIR